MVWSRCGADFTYRFPAIAEAVRGLAVDRALIDGGVWASPATPVGGATRRHAVNATGSRRWTSVVKGVLKVAPPTAGWAGPTPSVLDATDGATRRPKGLLPRGN
jgi:hypothetical protein